MFLNLINTANRIKKRHLVLTDVQLHQPLLCCFYYNEILIICLFWIVAEQPVPQKAAFYLEKNIVLYN